jgi:hypothetical protein
LQVCCAGSTTLGCLFLPPTTTHTPLFS